MHVIAAKCPTLIHISCHSESFSMCTTSISSTL